MNPFARVTVRLLVLCLMAASVVLAEDEKSNKFEFDKAGIRCTKPDDPSWKFIPEDQWAKMFTDPRDADNLGLWLVKMKTPEGTPGQEMPQVDFMVEYWADDTKLKFEDGTVVDAVSLKSFGKNMFKALKKGYKDIKDEKELGEVKGYKFAPKILKFSFMGVNVKYGSPVWLQSMFFKDNRKVYRIVIWVPAGTEKTFSKDIDTILKGIELYEVKK